MVLRLARHDFHRLGHRCRRTIKRLVGSSFDRLVRFARAKAFGLLEQRQRIKVQLLAQGLEEALLPVSPDEAILCVANIKLVEI